MAATPHNVMLEVEALEIAKGHDGFLRGKPEPVILLAAYVLDDALACVLGRSLHRFAPRDPFPSTVYPVDRNPIGVRIENPGGVHYAVVAIALEEDGGRDVQSLYGALERHQALSMWSDATLSPTPLHLNEIPTDRREWLHPTAVSMLIDGREAEASCNSDKWIGGAAWLLASAFSESRRYRLNFVSEDKRNDWTAFVVVRLSSARRSLRQGR